MREDYASRARALVGAPFRLQGRGLGGLDCVGVAIAAYGIDAASAPRDYRLRGNEFREASLHLTRDFRRVPRTQLRTGDLMVLRVTSDQLHLGVCTERGFVHANAYLRKVVETPGMPPWPLIGVYRKKQRG